MQLNNKYNLKWRQSKIWLIKLKIIEKSIKNNNRILVYDETGESISVAICIAYMMKERKMKLADSAKRIKERNPKSYPN